jgi:hypothetical protein
MNDTLNTPQERHVEGRTVRDIAERSPALVNEVWCRKILRQVLQSLDAQYTNDGPHRLIMPDTIVVQANGDAILLPDPDANPDFQPEIAADLRALAATIHYAITHEMPAAGPLMGRGLEGYSDSLLGAVDRCMAPNKSQRPQTVSELRDLLGMVSVGLLKPSATVPVAAAPAAAVPVAPAPVIAKPAEQAPKTSLRKWLWLIIAAVLLAAALYIVREHGAEKLVGATAIVPVVVPAAAPEIAPAPETAPAISPAPVIVAETPAAAAPATNTVAPAATTATYRLNVKPWGTIYVDGTRRGVSPPLKRLVLPAGHHTVMVENPGFADHIVEINSASGATGTIAHDFPAAEPAPASTAAN